MNASSIHFYQFDSFRLDVKKRRLLRDEEVTPLTPKLFDTLLALVERGGEVLEKDELLKLVWPDSFVEEGNLSSNISLLRKALGEQPHDHRYIVTVPGRGYSFVAEVKKVNEDGAESNEPSRAAPPLPELKTEALTALEPLPLSASRRKALALALWLGVALCTAVYFLLARSSNEGAARAQIRSLTILPFTSRTPGDEYLALGATETLIVKLRNLKPLTVRPTSAFQNYRSFGGDPLAIARRLGVTAALRGELQRAGDDVSVQITLLRATDNARLWEQTFSGKLDTFIALQDTLAERLIAALGLRLTRREQESLRKRGTDSLEALEAYLKGRALWNNRSEEGLFQSMLHFEQAVARDPRFALGYAGLASAYAFDGRRWATVARVTRQALELDPTLAEPHAMLGFVRLFWERKWNEAEQEFKQAVARDPTYATAHHWYALHSAFLGGNRYGASVALDRMKQALQLEPFAPVLHADLGQLYYFTHDYERALAACRQALALEPDFINAHRYLYDIYTEKNLYDQAVEKFLYLAERLEKNDPATRASLRQAYATGGMRGFWQQRIKVLSRYPPDEYGLARYYARLGQPDAALDWLERAERSRAFKLISVNADPVFDGLRHRERFRQLLRRLGLI